MRRRKDESINDKNANLDPPYLSPPSIPHPLPPSSLYLLVYRNGPRRFVSSFLAIGFTARALFHDRLHLGTPLFRDSPCLENSRFLRRVSAFTDENSPRQTFRWAHYAAREHPLL